MSQSQRSMAAAGDSVWPHLSDYHRARFALESIGFLRSTRAIGYRQAEWMRSMLVAGLAPHIRNMIEADATTEESEGV